MPKMWPWMIAVLIVVSILTVSFIVKEEKTLGHKEHTARVIKDEVVKFLSMKGVTNNNAVNFSFFIFFALMYMAPIFLFGRLPAQKRKLFMNHLQKTFKEELR